VRGSPELLAPSPPPRYALAPLPLSPLGESDLWTPMGPMGPQKSGRVDRRPDALHREAGRVRGFLPSCSPAGASPAPICGMLSDNGLEKPTLLWR
jgi:hypothetical protein